MFKTQVKSISISFALALILGAGPAAGAGAPPVTPGGTPHFNLEKKAGDYTISVEDHPLLARLDGIKLLGRAGPSTDRATKFDVTLEIQGMGVQFETDRTYAFMRADRAFTNEHRLGIQFRFQF